MKYYLKKIDNNLGYAEYEMYQDIPLMEIGSTNIINGLSFDDFKKIIKKYLIEEINIDNKINTTTNRYILYVDNKPVGELGIRTTLNDFWINKGSQMFYRIRVSERHKGYGTKILELGLLECKKLGFKKIRINCDDHNIGSKKVIIKNGGQVDIKSYHTKDGTSSSYLINLE